jgi:phosphatidylglycerol---prolipoprotein diacylglyceryl transferase
MCYIMLMFVHEISRIAFEVGPLTVRWYGVMFALGVVGYYFLTAWLWKREKWPLARFDLVVIYLFFGLVIGARLGEVFFYHPGYYLSQPVEIFKIWKGGLASHGATIGLLVAYLAFWLWVRRGSGSVAAVGGRLGFWKYVDLLVVAMPLVAGFVRIGNFFNSEIVGRVSDLPWAVQFALNGDTFGRHPVQLYEGLWAWIVFVVLLLLWLRRDRWDWLRRGGVFVFLFIGMYFAGRFGIEFFKEYQVLGEGGFLGLGLTMGQWLSVVPVVVAVGYFAFFYPKIKKSS